MKEAKQQNLWWQGAVIYQVYPRSFNDSNNDGVGDLRGIIEKLDYIAKLGVDGIWVSPFFKSPMKDFGYDVSDYQAVDPLFGCMEDFDELVEQAHARNLKVLIDQVISHTSEEHPWFAESRQDKSNAKADWYVWADAKADGSAPNNWLSIFGGFAWRWDEGRQQYFLHNFLESQPDLNFHNPEVVAAVLATMKFWLDKGVDGFRLDTVNFYVHDKQLRDNPMREPGAPGAEGVPEENPYSKQYHLYDKSQPENFAVLKQIRQLCNQYQDIVTLGELGDDNSVQTSAAYCEGDELLHLVYHFKFLEGPFEAGFYRETIQAIENEFKGNFPCFSFNNHDVVRAATRWQQEGADSKHFAKFLMALLLTLRGTVCLYQGEELGLPESDVAFEDLQDPYGKAFYPEFKGRDGCRTPMPWEKEAEQAGFSKVKPWLPVESEHLSLAVDQQQQVADSVLRAYQNFLAFRKQHPALRVGDIQFVDAQQGLLAFTRECEAEKLLVLLNFTDQLKTFDLNEFDSVSLLGDLGSPVRMQERMVELQGFEFVIAKINGLR